MARSFVTVEVATKHLNGPIVNVAIASSSVKYVVYNSGRGNTITDYELSKAIRHLLDADNIFSFNGSGYALKLIYRDCPDEYKEALSKRFKAHFDIYAEWAEAYDYRASLKSLVAPTWDRAGDESAAMPESIDCTGVSNVWKSCEYGDVIEWCGERALGIAFLVETATMYRKLWCRANSGRETTWALCPNRNIPFLPAADNTVASNTMTWLAE